MIFRAFVLPLAAASLSVLAGCVPVPATVYGAYHAEGTGLVSVPTARPVPGAVSFPAQSLPIIMAGQRVEQPQALRRGTPVSVEVDVSEQVMTVSVDGVLAYRWPVSTARAGRTTPRGTFGVQWLSEFHKSSLYNDAPMPHSIFFSGNFAIHGTTDVVSIGTPASAGCVRLLPDDAEVLFDAVETVGENAVSITIRD